ncbi:MAG TPA: DUF3795 domain-containing protein [Sedimentisphaerales bacterium]|nr:DUF3795 domain-containing protein [Sedimentisphaerales bacterium]HRV49169.1 DUF3795 domain-containing protein [Sedimentisphaerales bacterium]
MKKYPAIGVCGLDCGLCPRYYTAGPSRCPGCAGPDFFHKHPSCSFITCAVRNKGLEACGQCPDFPCAKFKSEKEYGQVKESSSYPPYQKVMANLKAVKEHGIEAFARQQAKRIKLLERMLAHFDDGRSKSCYCRAAALLDPAALENELRAAARKIKAARIPPDDAKARARVLRALLDAAR